MARPCVLVLTCSLILAPATARAASHYIRSSASGTTCADWGANACKALPSSLVRGDTYYIAGGTYAGRTFSTPTSGALVITIKGATAADHGTSTGWSNSYSVESAQATWTSELVFATSYWVFDGSVGPTWSRTPSQYGFAFSSSLAYPVTVGANGSNTTDFVISHVAATAPAGDLEKFFLGTGNQFGETDNVTISHSYFSGWGNVYWATSPLGAAHYQDNWLFEYNVVLNGFSSSLHHGEDLNNNYGIMKNQVARYNWFEGRTSGTGVIVANNADNIGAKIYGNIFKDNDSGNGIITGTSAGNLVSPEVYNNTFINCSSGGWIGGNTTGTPLVYNNLIYNMNASLAVAGDYNAYYSATSVPAEPHKQVGTGSPFVNLATGDLRLSGPTQAGYALASPYGVDVTGAVRGADGTWDRGAYEYSSKPPLKDAGAPADGGAHKEAGLKDAAPRDHRSAEAATGDGVWADSAEQRDGVWADSAERRDGLAADHPAAGDQALPPSPSSGCSCQQSATAGEPLGALLLQLLLAGVWLSLGRGRVTRGREGRS